MVEVKDPEVWQEFLEGRLWADMVREINEWDSRVREEYDVCDGLLQLGKIQGRIEALSYLRGLPLMLRDEALESCNVQPSTEVGEEVTEDEVS